MNILEKAKNIVYDRKEEKERKYGDFHGGMESARDIFNSMTGKNISTREIYLALIALKFSRIRFGEYNEDNFVDICGYLSSLNDYEKENNNV